ncbi:MAG: hypothetical protein HQL45_09290 [Alphaproteobacteria bacterium]|nr:hypothetical protein [Alphaproteobacteria bacterium]
MDVLENCSSTQPLCVEMKGNLNWSGERQFDVFKHPSVRHTKSRRKSDPDYYPILIRVMGRLEGGPVETYFLRLTYPNDLLDCNDLSAALVGRHQDGRGILLTRQGRFETTSSEIKWGDKDGSVVVSDDGKQIVHIIAPGWESSVWKMKPVFKPDGHVLWRKGKLCLDIDTDGMFERRNAKECEGDEPIPASDAEIKELRRSVPPDIREGLDKSEYETLRQPSTRWMMLLWGIACT